MAELLVRVVDKVNTDDFYLNIQCFKAGMVIAVQPDGWLWGKEEVANPAWRIFKVPSVDPSQFSNLLSPEPSTDPGTDAKTLQPRGFKLSLVLLGGALGPTFIIDNTQVAPNAVNPIPALPNVTKVGPVIRKQCAAAVPQATLRAATVAVTPVSDPNAIGASPAHVIG